LIFSTRQEIVVFPVTIITKQQAHIRFVLFFQGRKSGSAGEDREEETESDSEIHIVAERSGGEKIRQTPSEWLRKSYKRG
jgi:hypothetical protein